ncbi:MAG TPA: ATP-dependent DNA helicase [Candidatus Saccharimonadales bacterium]|nr:ATP-dependent DNA helicase [Candidatus Saccharimonadales bacterium]
MSDFEEEYARLNKDQKKAVDITEGPMIVRAGPGTGKTQLLSMRVANILKKTDSAPGNILCLTFTDNAARNMRERLAGIIGQPAYHVFIHTFHSFGTEIINRYPDYFSRRQLLQQVDELGQYELLQEIFEQMPHSNPLSVKVGEQFIHLKSTLDVISWLKRNAIAPVELHEILNANHEFMEKTTEKLAEVFVDTPTPKYLKAYGELLKNIQANLLGKEYFGFVEYGLICAGELETAINSTAPDGRFAKEITAWRNRWCKKDSDGKHVYKDGGQNYRKMHAVANAYQKMLDMMSERGLYDFDDMVIEAVHAMEVNDELRLNLQEQFQYVLVDEFQDTNKSQLRMLTALGSNPVHENRPNIMVVGDDDQAIYSFQGADISNMAMFNGMYSAPEIIILRENYRSNSEILRASEAISGQITDRIFADGKELEAKKRYDTNVLRHTNFVSELAQYDWVGDEINKLIKAGTKPDEIAVIAPRHKYLERLMPYLGDRDIPVAYERRENILEAPVVKQLLTMSELVVAIAGNRQGDIDGLIAEVLGYDFWQIPGEELIQTSLECYDKHEHWMAVLANHKNKKLKEISLWFADLARRSKLEPMEYIIDQLIGAPAGTINGKEKFSSPLRAYYFNPERYEHSTDLFLTLLGQLSTLRNRLRQWKPNKTLYINDFVEFSELHNKAKLKIIDTNPHTQTTNAVQVMTVYKAKGLEFEAVFVINAQDEVWGPTVRSQNSRITLPKNLPIKPAGEADNDKLRLLFVALTRAKHTLYITSYNNTLDNKPSPALSFLMDTKDGGKPIHPAFNPKNIDKPVSEHSIEILSTDWAYRFRQVIADKKTLFEPILANYKLSVTHLNNFLDVREGGPDYFFLHNLLRFPEALSPSAAYGDAVHKTFQWAHTQLRVNGKLPQTIKIEEYFADILSRKHLKKTDHKKMEQRGRTALKFYFSKKGGELKPADIVERGFNNEGVVVGGANLSGKIDKLSLIEAGKVEVVDFKTGKPAKSWQGRDEHEKIKLYKYKQQLMFYKLLVEHSASFSKKLTVAGGALEFIEPDENGRLVDNLELSIDPTELSVFVQLINAVWVKIINLDFPDVSRYPKNLRGIKEFEHDLLKK